MEEWERALTGSENEAVQMQVAGIWEEPSDIDYISSSPKFSVFIKVWNPWYFSLFFVLHVNLSLRTTLLIY